MDAKRYPEPETRRGAEVRGLFARIAPRYDLANRILSFSVDRAWRRRVVRELGPRSGTRALDLFCGTGDLTRLLARTGAEVVGADFCPEMIAVALRKSAGRDGGEPPATPRYVAADVLSLPFPDHRFDLVTAAFGVRNLEDLDRGIGEMVRVTRPGGRVGILEFARPASAWLRAVYGIYLRWLLPRLGGLVTGDGPSYRYLSRSIPAFLDQGALRERLRRAGLTEVRSRDLSGGIATLYIGSRPDSPA